LAGGETDRGSGQLGQNGTEQRIGPEQQSQAARKIFHGGKGVQNYVTMIKLVLV
jgi:hypothetical protein